MAETTAPAPDPVDPDVVAVMHRVRDAADAAHKRQFAKDFHATLELIGVAPGGGFFIVTAEMWDALKEQRDDARQERDEYKDALDNAPGVNVDQVYVVLDDLKRGLFDIDELEDQMERAIGASSSKIV